MFDGIEEYSFWINIGCPLFSDGFNFSNMYLPINDNKNYIVGTK